jgi:hypothetical protein
MARDDDYDNDDDLLADEELIEDDDLEDEVEEIVEGETMSGVTWFVAGLVIGAFVGAGAALLAAPERGVVTRRRIKRRLRDLQQDARDQVDDWRGQAGSELGRRRRRLRKRLER